MRATRRGAIGSSNARVPALRDLIAFATRSAAAGRPVGLYLETKQPQVFEALGHDLERLLVAALRAHGLDRAGSAVYVQSFQAESVRELARALPIAAVQLVSASRGWIES